MTNGKTIYVIGAVIVVLIIAIVAGLFLWHSQASSLNAPGSGSGNSYAYVANFDSNNVIIVDVTTGNIHDAITSGFYGPSGIAFYSGNAYVVNVNSSNVVKINPSNGGVIGSWTSGFNYPFSIAFYSGNAYVVNGGSVKVSSNVVKINPSDGGVIGSWTSGFKNPLGIAFPT